MAEIEDYFVEVMIDSDQKFGKPRIKVRNGASEGMIDDVVCLAIYGYRKTRKLLEDWKIPVAPPLKKDEE